MNKDRMYQVILAPHISEKAVMGSELGGGQTFKVAIDATKLEVRNAVETIFSVKVEDVRMVRVKGKVKRHGARIGRRSDWKKAIVKLAEGQEIDISSFEVK